MSLPVNFEDKVRLPAAVGGAGYPYRISARDLMENFRFLMNQMPAGFLANEMIIFNGEKWVILAAPPSTGTYVFTCVNGVMQWIEPETCP